MSFIVNQSLSVNQRKNNRLNEYFAVVGLNDGPLLLADPPPHLSEGAGSASAEKQEEEQRRQRQQQRRGQQDVPNGGGGGDPVPREESLSPMPLATARVARPTKRPSYGSYELGTMRGKAFGGGDDADGPLRARFRARVLHRFPAYDHEGSPFPCNLSLFCLPGGLRLSMEMKLPTFFAFVHTRANGQHMFGYCLCLYEPLEKRHRSELQKLVDAHDAWLRARRPHGRRNSGVSREEARVGIGTGDGDIAQGRNSGGKERMGKGERRELVAVQGTMDEDDDRFPATLDPNQEVYSPKCLCLLSTWPYFEQFREWFLNLYRISLSPYQIPLERYISNFLLEVPTPSPGKVKVLYNMGNTTISFACPPPNKPVAWRSVPFEPLFKCLSHENILTIFSCLLLERSLLLKSSQLSLLTCCAEVLVLLMYPFSWSHVYIPVLPEALLGVLSAPMPFLIGVHRSFIEETGMDVAPYVVEVDLDNDRVYAGMQAPTMPDLPPKRKAKLLAKLGEHAQLSHCRTRSYRQEVMQKSDLAFSMALRPCDFDDENLDTPPPDWDAVREAFLRFFVALLTGYRRFLVYPTKANPSPVRLFNTNDYLDKLDREARPFAEAMCGTQAFQNFVDIRMQPEAGDLDILFFDASIVAKKNRSMLLVIKKDANFLRPDTYVAKTVYALTPDTTGLDMSAPAKVHDRFPNLSAALYPVPRDIPSLSNPSDKGGDGGGGSRREGGDGGDDYGPSGPNGRDGDTGGSSNGDARMFRLGSWKGQDEWAPLSAEATILAVFLIGFCATIGVEPPRGKHGAGNAPPSSTKPSTENTPSPATTEEEKREHASPGSDTAKSPQLRSTATSPASMPLTRPNIAAAADQGSESSWGSGPAKAPTSSDAGGSLSTTDTGAEAAATASTATSTGAIGISLSPSFSTAAGATTRSSSPEDTTPTAASGAKGSSNGNVGVGGGVKGKGGAKTVDRKPSRLAFSELKHDVREERLYKANAGLTVAFEALAAMLRRAPSGDEAVYRSLISACGRSGNSEKAMVVVELMMSTGIVPDAMVSRCLVDAFAMDDTFLDGRAHPLALLDWSKFQPKQRDERRFHDSSVDKAESSFSLKKMIKRFERSADEILSVSPAAPATPASSPAAIAAAAAAAGPGASAAIMSLSPVWAPSLESVTGMGLSISAPNTGDTEGSRRTNSRADLKASPAHLDSSAPRDSFEKEGTVRSWGSAYDSSGIVDKSRPVVLRRSFETGSSASGHGRGDDDRRISADNGMEWRAASPPNATNPGISVAMHQQVLLGERLLEQLFPDLKIDNVGETCPSCQSKLSRRQVREGWSADPNDYTTECRAIIDLRSASPVDAVGMMRGGGGGGIAATSGEVRGGGHGGGVSFPGVMVLPGVNEMRGPKRSFATCKRRFVSRFSVHSTAEGWEGTTGPGTPLWCEYLPPWVLRKEFHNILAWFGVQYLCSARFREGLGPAWEEDEDSQRLSGGGGAGGGATRAVDRTIFWNLVVHFRDSRLPLTFLLEDDAGGRSSPVLI